MCKDFENPFLAGISSPEWSEPEHPQPNVQPRSQITMRLEIDPDMLRERASEQAENYRNYFAAISEARGQDPLQYIQLDDRTIIRLFARTLPQPKRFSK